MAWIEPQRLPLLVSGVAMLLLAGLLLRIDFHKRVNRAFAAFLTIRGLSLSLFSLDLGAGAGRALVSFGPYLSLALLPVLLYFGSMFPRRRGLLGRPGMGWVALTFVVVLDGLYFLWHAGYQTLAEGDAPTDLQFARPGLYFQEFGPLSLLGFGTFPLTAALGLLFARDYTHSERGTQRTSYFLVAAGFLVNGMFDGTRQTLGLVRLLQDGSSYEWLPWNWTFAILPALSLLPALAGLIYIGVHRFRGREVEGREENRRESLLFALAGLAALTGLAPLLLPAGSEFFDHPLTLILLGLWRLTLPLFVTYALLRYALFDIDLKVRAAVAWTFVVAVFGGVYFLVSETLEGLVSDRLGQYGGLAAAALLTLAGGPLASLGRRVAKALMPGVRDLGKEMPLKAGETIYRQQFLMLQEDGNLTEKERRSLEELRQHLGLAPKRASAIEAKALAGGAVPQAGAA